MAAYADGGRVQQTVGPTISSMVDFMDGTSNAQPFIVEDDGFPNVLLNSLRACLDQGGGTDLARSILKQIERHVRKDERTRNVTVWLRWKPEQSRSIVEAILAAHKSMTEATGGRLMPNPAWRIFKSLVTLHPSKAARWARPPKRVSSITVGRCSAIRTSMSQTARFYQRRSGVTPLIQLPPWLSDRRLPCTTGARP